MPQAFHRLFFHVVWATKERLPLLVGDAREQLLEAVVQSCRERQVEPVACNCMEDHIHLCVQLTPTTNVADFIGQIKGASSYTINQKHGAREPLKWQRGYGVVSLREDDVPKVVKYIENQQEIQAARKASRLLETTEE
jgi:putative transposase